MARAIAKKTATKKKVVRKTTAKKKAAAAGKASGPAIRSAMTKTQLLTALSENTGVAKKEVTAVMDELTSLIERHVKKRSSGQFSLPGLLKIRTIRKKATKARPGRNPFTGENIMIKAKPAHTVVKVTPLAKLKAMVDV